MASNLYSDGLPLNSDGLQPRIAMASNLIAMANSDGLQLKSDGLQPMAPTE